MSKWQQIIQLRTEINQVDTKVTIQRITKTNSSFRKNKIDKPLTKLSKQDRDRIQISKIRNEMEDITTDTEEMQKKIIRSYCKSLYSTKLENLNETDDFLDKYHVSKLSQDFVNYLTVP